MCVMLNLEQMSAVCEIQFVFLVWRHEIYIFLDYNKPLFLVLSLHKKEKAPLITNFNFRILFKTDYLKYHLFKIIIYKSFN